MTRSSDWDPKSIKEAIEMVKQETRKRMVESTTTPPATKPTAPRPFTITSVNRSQRYLKMMVYGDYGTGKTTLAATALDVESMRDVLLIDAEGGDLSISDREDLDVIRISTYGQIARAYEYLRLHTRHRDSGNLDALADLETRFRGVEVSPDQVRQYRTVIVDSLSEVQKYAMYQLTGVQVGVQKLDIEPSTPEFKEWGQNSEMIRLLVRTFRDLPMHVIFVAAEQQVEDDRKRMNSRPHLPGKLGGEVQGFLDVVGYLQIVADSEGRPMRRLHLQPGRNFQAKNRFALSNQPFIDMPSMHSLAALAGIR